MMDTRQIRFFASDNAAAVHPRIMEKLQAANASGHAMAYGDDEHTKLALQTLEGLFGPTSSAFFVYNGTAANVISIRSLLKGYESVLASPMAHIDEDECGSLEANAGVKIEHLLHEQGKIIASSIPNNLKRRGFVHSVQPRLLSLTQSNEYGQVYSIEEMREFGRICKDHNLLYHVDGARIANAVASLLMESELAWFELSSAGLVRRGREILAAITIEAGVHVLSFGGTKNGLMFGEAIVLMNGVETESDLPFYRKQGMQLASKMRYISAQFNELYKDDLWIQNALHANTIARYFEHSIANLERHTQQDSVQILLPVQANAVFLALSGNWVEELRTRYHFHSWGDHEYRFVFSWDSTEKDVDDFIEQLESVLAH